MPAAHAPQIALHFHHRAHLVLLREFLAESQKHCRGPTRCSPHETTTSHSAPPSDPPKKRSSDAGRDRSHQVSIPRCRHFESSWKPTRFPENRHTLPRRAILRISVAALLPVTSMRFPFVPSRPCGSDIFGCATSNVASGTCRPAAITCMPESAPASSRESFRPPETKLAATYPDGAITNSAEGVSITVPAAVRISEFSIQQARQPARSDWNVCCNHPQAS